MTCSSLDDFFFIQPNEPNFGPRKLRAAFGTKACQQQDMTANGPAGQADAECFNDILQHMVAIEETNLPDEDIIDRQPEIQWSMRPLLMNFIIENHASCGLLPETLFLAVHLLDRYSCKMVIQEKYYELVGSVALWLASKYVEKQDQVPKVSKLAEMCFGVYTPRMFIQMENHVLNALEWYIGHPTVSVYAQFRAAATCHDTEVEHMADYLCEIALHHREFVSTRPSIMSDISLALARVILGRYGVHSDSWTHIDPVALALHQHLDEPYPFLTLKYKSLELSCVSQKLTRYIDEQKAMMRRAESSSSPPNELVAKFPIMDGTPQKSYDASVGFSDLFTPPNTPGSVYPGIGQPYAASPTWPVTSTCLSTLPAKRSAPAQNALLPVKHHRNSSCTMNHSSTKGFTPCEAVRRQNLLSPLDYHAGSCDCDKQTDVWSHPEGSDLPHVCWFEGGCNDANWNF